MSLRVQFVLLAIVVFLSGCSNLARKPQSSDKSPSEGPPINNTSSVPESPGTNETASPNPAPATANQPAETNVDIQRSALLEADLNFSRMSEEKGAAQAFFEFLAPEGVSLFEGELPMRGRDAIKVHLAAGQQGFFTWQPAAADVARSGDMGFTWGTAIFQGKGAEDKPRISHSKYVSVWKKQPGGRWKVVLFSTSSSPPPSERQQ